MIDTKRIPNDGLKKLIWKLLSFLASYLVLIVFEDYLDPDTIELVISLTELLA